MQVTALDDFDGTSPATTGPAHKSTGIGPIGPDLSEARETPARSFQHLAGPVAVLKVSRVHHHRQDQAERVYQDMAFTPFDLLARVVPPLPPFPVLTVWLSRIAALGVGLRPSLRRTCSRSRS